MNKIYTLIATLMVALSASAQQDVCFRNANGNDIKDGSVITMNKVEVDDFDDTIIPLTGLSIRNNTSANAKLRLTVQIDNFSGRSFACCVGSSCHYLSKAGSIIIDNISVSPNSLIEIINTEWVVKPNEYGTLATKFILETQKGMSYIKQTEITVNFTYKDPASINEDKTPGLKVVKTYDITGRETNAHKGLLLQLMSDGSVHKVLR